MSDPAHQPPMLELWQQFYVLGKMLGHGPLSASDLAHQTHLKLWLRQSDGAMSPFLHLLEKLGDKSTITLEDWEILSDLVLLLLEPLHPARCRDAPAP